MPGGSLLSSEWDGLYYRSRTSQTRAGSPSTNCFMMARHRVRLHCRRCQLALWVLSVTSKPFSSFVFETPTSLARTWKGENKQKTTVLNICLIWSNYRGAFTIIPVLFVVGSFCNVTPLVRINWQKWVHKANTTKKKHARHWICSKNPVSVAVCSLRWATQSLGDLT